MSYILEGLNRKKAPPQFDYHWRVELPLIPGFNMLDLHHRVYSVDIPHFSFDVRRFAHANTFKKAPNHMDYPALAFRIDEFEDQLTIKYLMAWRKLIKDDDGSYFPPVNYKKDFRFITIDEMKEDLDTTVIKGVWPAEISPSSWSYDGSSVVQYTVTLPVDYIEYP